MTSPADRPVDSWRLADMPDQAGRTAVVTGPSVGGLGHHTALELARRGARVVLAGRTPAKLEETAAAITAEVPAARLEQLVVDLSSLASVREAAGRAGELGAIDLLVNNAGVMAPTPRRTDDGFDLQLATNHLGPFLLTGLLLPQLVESGAGRVVAVSSIGHRLARKAPLGDPRDPRSAGSRWLVYGQTKLANLLFTHELDRRAREAGVPVKALAAHPGASGTHLAANGQFGRSAGGLASILDAASRAVLQSAAAGALPTLMAATADLPGSTFVGPDGPGEISGRPRVTDGTALSRDPEAMRRLWELSEDATSLTYP